MEKLLNGKTILHHVHFKFEQQKKLWKMLMDAFYFLRCGFGYKSSSGTIQKEQKNNIETVTQLHRICLLMTNNKK